MIESRDIVDRLEEWATKCSRPGMYERDEEMSADLREAAKTIRDYRSVAGKAAASMGFREIAGEYRLVPIKVEESDYKPYG